MAAHLAHRIWRFQDRRYVFPGESRLPLLMGILNVTPDSFSDGGQFFDRDAAVARALALAEAGADFLDVGGESTRPGSLGVSLDQELQRTIPVIAAIASRVRIPISIDTSKAEVARQALAAGASIVNDVTGLAGDPTICEVCRAADAGVIVMHMQGTPADMQNDPRYDNVVEEICAFFTQRLIALERAGIERERIVLDPGIGFGKTAAHNLEILMHVGRFQELRRPVLIGHSRKRFLEKLVGRPVDERNYGTLGVSLGLAQAGVDLLRIHDVRAHRDALMAFGAIAH